MIAKMNAVRTPFIRLLSQIGEAARLIWAASPRLAIAWSLLFLLLGLLPVGIVYLSRVLVDGLAGLASTEASWASLQPVLVPLGSMAILLLASESAQSVGDWIRAAQAERMQDHISSLIHQRSVAVDLAFYEAPDFHDRLHRARSDAAGRVLALLEAAGGMLQSGVTLIGLVIILVPYGIWLPPLLAISTLPALYVAVRFHQHYHRWWEHTTPDRRWTQYYDTMLTHSAPAAELRLFALGAHFQSLYRTLRERLRAERLSLLRRQSLARLGASLPALLITGIILIWMVWRVIQGIATLGDLVLFYQVFSRGQGLMRALWDGMGQAYAHTLFLKDLFDFLNVRSQIVDPQNPLPVPPVLREGIRFDRVTFRYPASQHYVLRDFDLTLPAGKITAIVGANGAGKTTLIKLLCRFYDPESGCIELDGYDLRKLRIQELRERITVLFQFPVAYHATVVENIALGDIAVSSESNRHRVEAAASYAGADEIISRLPRGYDTLLGKWFADGVELSGGEWQRIALARAFLKQAPIIVLDEPTSFMDSWSEMDWLARFRALARGRTALVITHRFTTAMCADIIHVMNEGKIVESGSHEELLARSGRYAQSWSAQTRGNTSRTEIHRDSPNLVRDMNGAISR